MASLSKRKDNLTEDHIIMRKYLFLSTLLTTSSTIVNNVGAYDQPNHQPRNTNNLQHQELAASSSNKPSRDPTSFVDSWMQDSGAVAKCQNEAEIRSLLFNLQYYPSDCLQPVTSWMKDSGAWDKCKNGAEIRSILSVLKDYPSDCLKSVITWMQDSGAVNKCKNGYEIRDLIYFLNDYPSDCLKSVTAWMQGSGAVAKCKNGYDICSLLYDLKDYPSDRLQPVTSWMKDSGAWDKCQKGTEISSILYCLKDYLSDCLQSVTSWMKDSGAWDKCQNGYNICSLLYDLKDYPSDRLQPVTSWMQDSGVLNKCQDGYDISSILSALKDYSSDCLKSVITWMQDSGAVNKCKNRVEISFILSVLKGYPFDCLQSVTTWMKDSGAVNKCKNGYAIRYLLSQLKGFDLSLLTQTSKKLPVDIQYIGIYSVNLLLNPQDSRFKEVLEILIVDGQGRSTIIETIISFCGEDSEAAQHFLQLAIGYDNTKNPNSFLAVHQELLTKREDHVTHNQISLDPRFQLNVDIIKEPVSIKPIHIPVNVWNRFFDKLRALTAVEKSQFAEILGETSLDHLLTLQTESVITDLLDPLDSLKIRDRVSTHSLKLRQILNECQSNDTLGQFVQLLVNIQTCPAGKINGIIHSHILMNQGRELNEQEIGKRRFKEEIVNFFKEELRRLREITLTDVLVKGLKLNQADPHDLYYLRGVIGGELGLNQADEIQKIDLHGHNVNKNLRNKTKQELLDLFYKYYKVEDVVSRIHIMLNNGSIRISGCQNLTISIINEYLQDIAFDVMEGLYQDSYVILDDNGKAIGLTPKAAKNLLLIMGILVEKQPIASSSNV